MNAKNKKKLILSLIKDDLTNTKLVLGLNEIGLQATEYALNLNESIFDCLGIPHEKMSDVVFERYMELVKRIKYIDLKQDEKQLNALVTEIYGYLCTVKGLK